MKVMEPFLQTDQNLLHCDLLKPERRKERG